jgi:ABC-type sugar transport system ATPase subunit
MAELEVRQIRKEFGSFAAVKDASVRFDSARVTCLLGPSGCGKTTLMRMIAGLETPTSGDVLFDGVPVTSLSPSARDIGMVFQYPVVYQGLTVRQNVELPLRAMRRLSPSERARRVVDALEILDSGSGRRQRRRSPDPRTQAEGGGGTSDRAPTAHHLAGRARHQHRCDHEVAAQARPAASHARVHQTIVYVTHDQTEAMTLADEILLMNEGEIVQRGSPREVYNHPAHRFGGWFLGNPGMNFVPHQVGQEGAASNSGARSSPNRCGSRGSGDGPRSSSASARST